MVEDTTGQKALLGRPKKLRQGVLTCLSGFIEQVIFFLSLPTQDKTTRSSLVVFIIYCLLSKGPCRAAESGFLKPHSCKSEHQVLSFKQDAIYVQRKIKPCSVSWS